MSQIKITIQQIEQAIVAFIRGFLQHFPAALTKVAKQALAITQQAEKLLQSGIALTAITLDPALEPYREGILQILADLEAVLKLVTGDSVQGELLVYQVKIMKLIDGNRVRPNRYYLAAVVTYSALPESATKIPA